MRYPRRTKFVTAIVTLFSLLFMQLAVASYACPKLTPVEPPAVMMQASGQPMADCPEIDKQRPSLCQAHAHKTPQSLDKAEPPPVQPFVPVSLVALIEAPDEAIPTGFSTPASFLLASSTAPPIAIRHCCFRL
jgi:hypothetical protein